MRRTRQFHCTKVGGKKNNVLHKKNVIARFIFALAKMIHFTFASLPLLTETECFPPSRNLLKHVIFPSALGLEA
jgi:hypothetical protein